MIKNIAAASLALGVSALSVQASTVSVNLTGWAAEEANGSPAANWSVQGADTDSVFQSVNSRPSVFYKPGDNARGTALAGTITVETTSDDDFIGFVLGIDTGEMRSANADFWLVDWKQSNQNFYGNAGSAGAAGLALSRVSGDTLNAAESDFWNHTGPITEVARGTNLGSTGWADNTEYSFELTFTSTLIEVFVNDVLEISYTQADNGGNIFTDGSFGFYNYSQTNVRYAGITEENLPDPEVVPLPAGLPLLLAGLGAFGIMNRRKKA